MPNFLTTNSARKLRNIDALALFEALGGHDPAIPSSFDREGALSKLREMTLKNGALWLINNVLKRYDVQTLTAATDAELQQIVSDLGINLEKEAKAA